MRLAPRPARLVVLSAAIAFAAGCGGHHSATPVSSGVANKVPSPSWSASAASATSAAGPVLAFGKPAQTTGSMTPVGGGAQAGAPLEVTPTSVVYVKSGTGETAQNGIFAVVSVKDRAPLAAAAEEAPASGGGWKWIAPDGQSLSEGNGNAFNVTPSSFLSNGSTTQAGSYQWRVAVFDITVSQEGGTLVYADGHGDAFRWKVPQTDAGPQAAQLRSELGG